MLHNNPSPVRVRRLRHEYSDDYVPSGLRRWTLEFGRWQPGPGTSVYLPAGQVEWGFRLGKWEISLIRYDKKGENLCDSD